MSNSCYTCYKIVSTRNEELDELSMILTNLYNRDRSKFREVKLYELVDELGFDSNKMDCRGCIISWSYKDDMIQIEMDTAWSERCDVRYSIERKYEGVKVYYMECEPGCCLFNTNDASGDYFTEEYYLDTCDNQEYFDDIKGLVDYVSNIVGYSVLPSYSNVDGALGRYEDEIASEGHDWYYTLLKIQYVDD